MRCSAVYQSGWSGSTSEARAAAAIYFAKALLPAVINEAAIYEIRSIKLIL